MNYFTSLTNDASNHYDRAVEKSEQVVRIIKIHKFHVRLLFASCSIEEIILPSLSHLLVREADNIDLTINIWDSHSVGLDPLFFPWSPDRIGSRGEIQGYNSDSFCCAYAHGVHGLNILDLINSQGFLWINDISKLPYYERAAPLRNILHWYLRCHGLILTHAAAVSNGKNSMLITGKGGSGKSTTALSCLDYGLNYISDDYCLTSLLPSPIAISLFCSAKLFPKTLESLSSNYKFDALPYNPEDEKTTLQIKKEYWNDLIRPSTLVAIIVPVISENRKPFLRPISKSSILKAMVPSSIFQVPLAGALETKHFSELVRSLPCYELELSSQYVDNANLIREFLDKNES